MFALLAILPLLMGSCTDSTKEYPVNIIGDWYSEHMITSYPEQVLINETFISQLSFTVSQKYIWKFDGMTDQGTWIINEKKLVLSDEDWQTILSIQKLTDKELVLRAPLSEGVDGYVEYYFIRK